MKIKITNTGNLRQAILQSDLISYIEKSIEMDKIGAGVEVGFIYVVPFSVAQEIVDDRSSATETLKNLEER